MPNEQPPQPREIAKRENFRPFIGQIVQLRSGGPPMMVETLSVEDGQPRALCVWFQEVAKDLFAQYVLRHEFPVVLLHSLDTTLDEPNPHPASLMRDGARW